MILQGDCLNVLKTLDSDSIDACVTSPPFFGLRDYGTAKWEGGKTECPHRRESKKSDKTITGHKNFDEMLGVGDAIQKDICSYCGAKRIDSQLGLEKTPEEYVTNMVAVFGEVKRVLKKDGTLWLNLGDSYASTHVTGTKDDDTGWKHGELSKGYMGRAGGAGGLIKTKDLIGIPWRVAFALQADGWYLRQDIIWHKPNPMPESVTDRCTKAHEYIFLLTKSANYYYDHEAIKEPVSEISLKRAEYGWDCDRPSTKNNSMNNGQGIHTEKMGDRFVNPNGRNKRSVWTVITKPFKDAHFATFPPDLIEPCIKTTRQDAKILDPFAGAGTTGVVAKILNRSFIGIELNPDYVKMAEDRIKNTAVQEKLWEE